MESYAEVDECSSLTDLRGQTDYFRKSRQEELAWILESFHFLNRGIEKGHEGKERLTAQRQKAWDTYRAKTGQDGGVGQESEHGLYSINN